MTYSILEIAEIVEAAPRKLNAAAIDTLLTDSRSLTRPETSLFFAIRTESNDGHRYIRQLMEMGVGNFVVETPPADPETAAKANFLVVDSTVKALHRLAAHHRRRFSVPVIGVTGSRGKTVVKEWLYQLLRDDFSIVRSPRSYNSQIGVPLSIWDIDEATRLAIVEAGVSRSGEMRLLEEIIRPTITVVTNIGDEHSEGFSSIEEKCAEKLSLANGSDCVAFDGDDSVISHEAARTHARQKMRWSRSDASAPLFISSVAKGEGSTAIKFASPSGAGEIAIPFTAEADIDNAIVCLAALLCLRIPVGSLARRFRRLTPIGTRMAVSEGVNDCLLIHDSYTSDYLSLAPAIDFMRRRNTFLRSRTIILSDVLPESVPTETVYRKIAELLRLHSIDRFIGIGPELSAHRALFAAGSEFFATTKEFLSAMSASDFSKELILLKGSPEFGFEAIIEMLEARQHETVLEVNLDALVHNFNFYRSRLNPDTGIICMLKASGYGAGSYELAKTLQQQGAAYIAVAAHDEGVALRKAGITMPIMVLNPKVTNYKSLFANRLEPEVYSLDMCGEIIREARKYDAKDYPIHIKIDTGMHRVGFLIEELPRLAAMLKGQDNVRPESIFSHLATADDLADDSYALEQLDYFDRCCAAFAPEFSHKISRHILNTDGILRFPSHQYDMVRLGIGLYGIPTLGEGYDTQLRPVSTLRSVIIQIREWPAGTTVGYGRRGELRRPSRVATIPIGYADGFNRRLGRGNGSVWINGKEAPTVGNICMDLFMADVTGIDCAVGDKVEIFGTHITATDVAERLGTIPYEVLTSVAARVKRIYYSES